MPKSTPSHRKSSLQSAKPPAARYEPSSPQRYLSSLPFSKGARLGKSWLGEKGAGTFMAPSESLGSMQAAPRAQQKLLIGLVVLLFFAWGFATVLLDTLAPKLKGVFALYYTEVMLSQFSFSIGYFVFSLPAGYIISRIGYIRSAVLGLVVMICG